MFRIVAIAAGLLCAAASSASAYDCTETIYRDAKAKITLLYGMRLIQEAPKSGSISILVDDVFWRGLTYPEKQRFADAFVCAVAGAGNGLASARFRSLATGNIIGDWSYGRLTVR